MTRPTLAALLLVALGASFITGRTTAPTKTVEKTITVKSSTTEVTKNDVREEATKRDVLVRWRTKYVVRPDGTREETTEAESRDAAASETKASTTEASKTAETKFIEVERKVFINADRPKWAIAANYGLGLDGGQHFGGGIEARVAGPIWAGVQVDVPAKAAMLELRVEF